VVACADEDRDYWRGFALQRDFENIEGAAERASAAASSALVTDSELPNATPMWPMVPVECVDEDRDYWRGFAQQRDYALQTLLTGRFWQNPDDPDPFAHLGPVEILTVNLNVAEDDAASVGAGSEAFSSPQRDSRAAPTVEEVAVRSLGASPSEVVEVEAYPGVVAVHSPPPVSSRSPGDAVADGSTTDPSSYVECEDDANVLLQSKVTAGAAAVVRGQDVVHSRASGSLLGHHSDPLQVGCFLTGSASIGQGQGAEGYTEPVEPSLDLAICGDCSRPIDWDQQTYWCHVCPVQSFHNYGPLHYSCLQRHLFLRHRGRRRRHDSPEVDQDDTPSCGPCDGDVRKCNEWTRNLFEEGIEHQPGPAKCPGCWRVMFDESPTSNVVGCEVPCDRCDRCGIAACTHCIQPCRRRPVPCQEGFCMGLGGDGICLRMHRCLPPGNVRPPDRNFGLQCVGCRRPLTSRDECAECAKCGVAACKPVCMRKCNVAGGCARLYCSPAIRDAPCVHAHQCFDIYTDDDDDAPVPQQACDVSRWQQASVSYQHNRERLGRSQYTGRNELGPPEESPGGGQVPGSSNDGGVIAVVVPPPPPPTLPCQACGTPCDDCCPDGYPCLACGRRFCGPCARHHICDAPGNMTPRRESTSGDGEEEEEESSVSDV